MPLRQERIASLLTTSCLALLAAAQPAFAQEADDEAVAREIVVTGTNIRGVVPIGTPVQVIDSGELARIGKASAADMLRELPANFAGGVASSDAQKGAQDTSSSRANLSGGAGVNLRGLGALSTLVLINGRRAAAAGQFGDYVDISNIPLAAIERIEVLQDGASAVYGSDAVGGVVNFRLKRKFEGLELLGRLGTTTEGGGTEYLASAVWGTRWGDGSGGILLGYEFNRRERVRAEQRDYNGGDFSDRGGINWPRYNGRAGTAANIYESGAYAPSEVVKYVVPGGAGTGLTLTDLTPATDGVGNTFDMWAGTDVLPKMQRHSVFGSIDHEFSDALSVQLGGRYTRRRGDYRTGYASFYNALPATNPYYIAGASNAFGVVIDDLLTTRKVGSDDYAFEGELNYQLGGDWQVSLLGSYNYNKQNRHAIVRRDAETNLGAALADGSAPPSAVVCALSGITAANLSANASVSDRYCASLGYEPFNPYTTNPLSQQQLGQLFGYEDLTFNSRVRQGTLQVDGTLFELPGGPAKVAMGVDFRRETISGLLDFDFRSVTPLQVPYGKTHQNVWSFFGETTVPLVSDGGEGLYRLAFTAAVRHERFRGLKPFETTNPKIGLDYEPIQGFKIRGSWGTSFHAPPMRFQYQGPQPVEGGNAIFGVTTRLAPCSSDLVTFNELPPAGAECRYNMMIVSGGAGPVLKPERADTWSVGVDLSPPSVPNLRASLSYFNLKVKDRLVRISGGSLGGILANYFATGTSPYAGNIVFKPSQELVSSLLADPRFIGVFGPPSTSPFGAVVYATQANLAALKMDGVDFSASYRFDLSEKASVELFTNGTLITSYKLQGVKGGDFIDRLNEYDGVGNPVSLRARSGVNMAFGAVALGGVWNHVGGYRCSSGCYVPSATGAPTLNTKPIPIKAWNTFDFHVGFELGDLVPAMSDAAVRLSVLNAFNKSAPFVDTGTFVDGNAPEPYDAANATIIGRSVSLTLTTKF